MVFLRSIPLECLSLIFHRSNYASRCNPENLCDVYKGTRNDLKVQGGNDVALLRLTGPFRVVNYALATFGNGLWLMVEKGRA
jgi:hypothetical protein